MAKKDVYEQLHGETTLTAYRLKGDNLLVHQWAHKSVLEMLATMAGHPVVQLNKDLTEEGENSAYRNLRGEDVLPCRIVKAALVNGAGATRKAVKAHEIQRHVRILGHTSPLRFEDVNRCDVMPVKVGPWNDRVTDLRSRTMYMNWACDIVIRFPHEIISGDKIALALREAGESIGFCEMRRAKGHDYGCFEVEALHADEIEGIVKACASPERRFVIPPELLRAASAQLEDVDDRNPKRKAVAVVTHLAEAPARHDADPVDGKRQKAS